MSEIFHFKRFDVINEKSGLKVGTDGVLLGVATNVSGRCRCPGQTSFRVLDVGTGTGVVALVLAQRLENTAVEITALEIDAGAAETAAANFAASPWSASLRCIHSSLQHYESECGDASFDLIVSNPPYYDNSYVNGCVPAVMTAPRAAARHTETLSYRDIIAYADKALAPDGRIALILPAEEEKRLQRYAASFGFRPVRTLYVRTTVKKQPKRMVVELERSDAHGECAAETLVMMEDGRYTEEYVSLTREFYLNLQN